MKILKNREAIHTAPGLEDVFQQNNDSKHISLRTEVLK
jgi:hypothetical protein